MKNILFILADCLRANLVFGEGYRPPTPAMDELKRRGTSFTQVISSATTTTVCVTSFHTGCYPFMTGVRKLRGDVIQPSVATLAEILRGRGYQTHALMTGPLWGGVGLERGFDRYEFRERSSQLAAEWRDLIHDVMAPSDDPRPWFIYAHFYDIHKPRVVPPELDTPAYGRNFYERAVATFDQRLAEILARVDWEKTIVVFHADHGEIYPDTPWLEFREKLWQQHILGDKPWLMRMGIKRDPMVSTWTKLKRLTKMGHGFNLSEGLVRVPLIIAGSNAVPAAHMVPYQVRQVDIMPTIVELAGAIPPEGIAGRSLLPLARGVEKDYRVAYMQTFGFGRDLTFFMRGVRVPRWKYIDSPTDKRVRPQLYALDIDPQERRNVLRRYPGIAADMQDLMRRETSLEVKLRETEAWSAEEEELVEERLRDLGYI